MDRLLFARRKLLQIKTEISRVRTSDFHHPGAKRALHTIESKVFDQLLSDIDHVSPNASTEYLYELSFRVNIFVAHFHPIIGIILRSTNARNSFEVYDPILRLAKRLLGEDTVLVLSSEWDFIPFTMPSVTGVPNCTVVGLPVMEAANALLTPLAGHELGHGVWRSRKLNEITETDRESALCDEFLEDWETFKRQTGVQSNDDMRAQLKTKEWGLAPLGAMEMVCEEIFCDMLGVRLFGMGYLYAFEYFAAPSLGESDLEAYPSFDGRVRYLAEFARSLAEHDADPDRDKDTSLEQNGGWPGLEGYESRFYEDASSLEGSDRFLLRSAHRACERLVPTLKKLATDVCEADGSLGAVPTPNLHMAKEALKRFSRGLPAVGNMPDLVNAGWLGYLVQDFWRERPRWYEKKFRLVNELVLKSLDVTEFEQRKREHAAEVRQTD